MTSAGTGVASPLPREWPRTWADDELRLQWEFLTFLRITAVNKVAGLDRDLAAATPLPTSPAHGASDRALRKGSETNNERSTSIDVDLWV